MIILARHGRTESNASGLLLGRADPALDETGREQAARLAGAIGADGAVDRIISSPLLRTRQTADAISAVTGVEVEIDERFIELDYGEWDQRPLTDVTPQQWADWRADIDFAPPGGESLAALARRVHAALDHLATRPPDERIVVVTHVSPIKAAVTWALGGDDQMTWRMFVAPATITRISTARGVSSLHGFNDGAHLH